MAGLRLLSLFQLLHRFGVWDHGRIFLLFHRMHLEILSKKKGTWNNQAVCRIIAFFVPLSSPLTSLSIIGCFNWIFSSSTRGVKWKKNVRSFVAEFSRERADENVAFLRVQSKKVEKLAEAFVRTNCIYHKAKSAINFSGLFRLFNWGKLMWTVTWVEAFGVNKKKLQKSGNFSVHNVNLQNFQIDFFRRQLFSNWLFFFCFCCCCSHLFFIPAFYLPEKWGL